MNILQVSSEVFPYSKTGGLADMTVSLAKAQVETGHHVTIATPLYKGIREKFENLEPSGIELSIIIGPKQKTAKIWQLKLKKTLTILFVDQPDFFERNSIYGQEDDAERFIFFSKAVAQLASLSEFSFEIVHAHDWPSALTIPLLSICQRKYKKVFTVHNAAYQGRFSRDKFELTGLPKAFFNWEQMEFYNDINLLKGGIIFADLVTTVSPQYAKELISTEYGCGLEGVFKAKGNNMVGVLNGVDYSEWNTVSNPYLAAPYSADSLNNKAVNKSALQSELGLRQQSEIPLFGNISRFAEQKGIDILIGALEQLLETGAVFQFAGLGSGDSSLEHAMKQLSERHPDQIAVRIGYDTRLAHIIEAGTDFFVMPSRFEPCGLNQLYSLRYGAIPIVRATGGLENSIIDFRQDEEIATGIKFVDPSPRELSQVLDLALTLYSDKSRLDKIRDNGMRADFSWNRTIAEYDRLYKSIDH
ncbi:MAG: glycogen synthase GlgA [Verrucomicrobiota bacterium]|jgi:starch synthase|nr:glycogen synthase GlgA [Verrucomicrobiota bacterium]MEE2615335.1 glycogen synthase GlgA [Verrucomicrobiota bacterium]